MLSRKDLVGEWSLRKFEIENTKNKSAWGKNPHGLLIYTPNGYMSVAINRDIEGNFSSMISKHTSILFYAGTYEISEEDTIIHHVVNASDPDRIGKDMVRKAKLEGNNLTIHGSADFGISMLTWERITQKPELTKEKSPLLYHDKSLIP